MKDYDGFFVGNRTSKYDEQDLKDLFSKKDIDKFFESLYEEIRFCYPVGNNEIDYDTEKPDFIQSAFKLGYMQAQKEILKIVDNFETSILNHADEFSK